MVIHMIIYAKRKEQESMIYLFFQRERACAETRLKATIRSSLGSGPLKKSVGGIG